MNYVENLNIVEVFFRRIERKFETCHQKKTPLIGSYAIRSYDPDDSSLAVSSTSLYKMMKTCLY